MPINPVKGPLYESMQGASPLEPLSPETEEEDDDLITIEDAYVSGFLSAQQYQARLALIASDPSAALYRVGTHEKG